MEVGRFNVTQSWILGIQHSIIWGFPGGSDGKEYACTARDLDVIPGLGRSSGGGHDNPLQYSCLENPMDRGAWWAKSMGHKELDATVINTFTFS